MLATLLCVPCKKLKSPYIVGGIMIFLGAMIKMGIPSASSVAAITMVTFYPVMLAVGMPRKSAAVCVIVGTSVSFGPADMSLASAIPLMSPESTVPDLFMNYQMPTMIIVLLLCAIITPIWMAVVDKRDGESIEEEYKEMAHWSTIGCPRWYAIFPMLPVVMVLIFSEVIWGTISITVEGASMLSMFILLAVECLRKGSKTGVVELVNNTKQFFISMGQNLTSVVCITAAASACAGTITKIGGFGILSDIAVNAGLHPLLTFGVIVIFMQIIVLATTSPASAQTTMAPCFVELASRYGMDPAKLCVLSADGAGFARHLSPIAPIVVMVLGVSNTSMGDVYKRVIVPHVICTVAILCTVYFMLLV